jgi:putative phage-type endonuclease
MIPKQEDPQTSSKKEGIIKAMIATEDKLLIWPSRREDYATQEAFDAAWLDWRDDQYSVGSSDAAVICGVAPKSWGSPLELSLRKRGLIPRKTTQEWMKVGHLMEPVAAELYRMKTDCAYTGEQVCCSRSGRPWMKATLDRVTADRIVELKWKSRWSPVELGEEGDGDSLPAYWKLQAQHQLAIWGGDLVDFAVLNDGEVKIYPCPRNQELIDSLIAIEEKFRDDMIAGIDPEELVASDADILADLFHECEGTIDLDLDDQDAADKYDMLTAEIKELEDQKKTAKARLILSFGDMKFGVCPDGRTVVRSHWTNKARVQTVAEHSVTKFSIRKAKKA